MTTKSELLVLSDFAWQRLRRRVEGLTDEEYFWEPTPGCWTVRRDDTGAYRADGFLALDPPPFTTLAWRLHHIADILAGERNATFLGLEPAGRPTRQEAPATADDAVAYLEEAYAFWRRCLEAVDESTYPNRLGAVAGDYAEQTWLAFILHELDELIHHAAEVGTVRDLYRATVAEHPFARAVLAADTATAEPMLRADPGLAERFADLPARAAALRCPDAVRLLADLGFGVGPTAESPGPLHYAVAIGDVPAVRLLVGLGADPARRDPVYDADATGWAHYFGRPEMVPHLERPATG